MPLSIKNQLAEKLVHEVTRETGETFTTAIIRALEERLVRLRGRRTTKGLVEEIGEIAGRCKALPDLDSRTADEILGYDVKGTFRKH